MEWIKTAANNAVITRDEVLAWVKLGKVDLRKMVLSGQFPSPKFGMSARITNTARWRVGDIREWLDGHVHRDPENVGTPKRQNAPGFSGFFQHTKSQQKWPGNAKIQNTCTDEPKL
jgi:predicted DNA-binding transcriptional regulator AlpA